MTEKVVVVNKHKTTVEKGSSFEQYRLKTKDAGMEKVGYSWKRFSEFDKLRKKLKVAGEDMSVAPLPSKYFGTSPESRMEKLEEMMNEIVNSVTVNGDLSTGPPELLEFLGVTSLVKTPVSQPTSDTQEHIAHLPPPEEHKDSIEKCVEDLLVLEKAIDNDQLEKLGWKMVGSSGPLQWFSHAEQKRRLSYGVISQSTPRMVHDIFHNEKDFKKLEPNVATIKKVAELDGHTSVSHIQLKSIMWLAPRDCIFLRHWRVLESKTIINVDLTLDDYPGVPEKDTKGFVRAHQGFGGSILRQVPNQPTRTFVLMANDMDPKVTGIPESMEPKVNEFQAGMQAGNMKNLAELVKKKKLTTYVSAGPLQNLNGKASVRSEPIFVEFEEEFEEGLQEMQSSSSSAQPSLWLAALFLLLAIIFVYYKDFALLNNDK